MEKNILFLPQSNKILTIPNLIILINEGKNK
jgi:hypothetical protein